MTMLTQTQPTIVTYEPCFEGWLSAVFAVYANHWQDNEALRLMTPEDFVPSLLDTVVHVPINEDNAARVFKRLEKQLKPSGMRQLLWGLLSEQPNIGTCLLRIVHYALAYPKRDIMQDLGNMDVLTLAQTVKSVGREKHRMEAFVRFEHTTEDIYFARIDPDFNVLPLIGSHFQKRYQDQNWAIYDLRRGYGIYFDMAQSTPKRLAPLQTISDIDEQVLRAPSSIHSADEARYQRFWQGYFANVNIKERKNPKLHRQYLPQRYWRYLSEKQVAPNAAHLEKRRGV